MIDSDCTNELSSEPEQPAILDKYITPWALPGERFLVYFKWNPEATLERIRISMDPNVSVTRVLNADLDVFGGQKIIKNSFEISSNQIQLGGFAGFEGWYDIIPEVGKEIEFSIELVGKGQTTERSILKTEIVRPYLHATSKIPEIYSGRDSMPPLNPNVIMENVGKADVLEGSATPYFEKIEGRGLKITIGNVEVPYTLEERLFVTNPMRILPKIAVSGEGYGVIRIGFEYSDRIGNRYRSPLLDISVTVEVKHSFEFPIENSVKQNEPPLIFQESIPAIPATPLPFAR